MNSFDQLSVQELAVACRQARLMQCRSEADLSFELFCRALNEQDQDAWRVLQKKYQSMMKSWIYKTVSNISEYDAEDLTQIAYTKFWRNLSRQQVDIVDDFAHLGAVLKYLNQCAVTTAIDFLRKKQRLEKLDDKLLSFSRPYEPFWMMRMGDECEATSMVRTWVSTKLTDPVERLLLKLMFEYDMKPAEIVHQFPEQFPNKAQVRRVRERVIKRARRALVNTAV